MKTQIIVLSAVALGALAPAASAQQGTVNGAAGGAVTGAIIGGPAGAAVGGVAGAAVGTVIDPPPQRVVTYVEQAPAPASPVVVKEKIVVGKPLPSSVVLTPVPDSPKYAYAVVNKQRIIVDPRTRTVVQVVR
ncbi:Hypothetical protein RG1141_PA05480 (plasmid) [Neorhizobium galegae bv. officinalis bv. officinalis str. HAMBI 1141]|jgi:hypothetical protein|uniref:DUF1236 domain-containing protein n=4 Tax=Neorhizobium TaxID=1525371 RepID=A0A068TGA7_NEOGA|nr:DUF1236 domain-containing protein [Neorhizobium galegae]CDN57383.1 Hypothetical protein RG1141_PA05480 [Neorhizobium galegae bv. officinalis bv. officinalis str. HAMBI 1141]